MLGVKIRTDEDWFVFKSQFNKIHPEYIKKLKVRFQHLTTGEYRLCMLMKLDYNRIQISEALGESDNSASKSIYRLRKKMNFITDDELQEFLKKI